MLTKHRNSFIPCFLDQAYQTLLGKEEGMGLVLGACDGGY